MKKLTKYFMLLMMLFAAVSCSKDSEDDSVSKLTKAGGPFEISELIGNWQATQAVFLRIRDNWWVDIVAEGGNLSLTVESNDRCVFTIDPSDREAYTVSGEMFWGSYDGDVALSIVWDDNPNEASYFRIQAIELTATTFNLGCSSECGEYDYDNNGKLEVSDLGFKFIRI